MIANLLDILRRIPTKQGKTNQASIGTTIDKEDTPPLLMHFALAIVGVALVALLFMQRDSLVASIASVYSKVGLAMIGLLPLSVLLVALLIHSVTATNPRQPWVATSIGLLVEQGQLLGIFGTLEGLIRGVSDLTLDQGAEQTIHAISALISGIHIMFASSLWGISLVIPAVILKRFLYSRQKTKAEPVAEHTEDSDVTESDMVESDEELKSPAYS